MASSTPAVSTPTDPMLDFEIGSPLFYIVLGAGSVMVLLTACIGFLLCLILYLRHRKQTLRCMLRITLIVD